MPCPPRTPDPTPEQIAIACAEIRQGWSENEHRVRAGALAPVAWTIPAASFGIDAAPPTPPADFHPTPTGGERQ